MVEITGFNKKPELMNENDKEVGKKKEAKKEEEDRDKVNG